jgi:hypothetical protein
MAYVDWSSLPTADLLKALETAKAPLPLELVDALVQRKAEVVSPMLALLKNPQRWVDEGPVWTPLLLLHLFGMMGDPSAAPAIIDLATRHDLGDWATESLAGVLAALGPSPFQALETAAKVEATDPYVRHAFFRALYLLAVANPTLRPECARVARDLFARAEGDFQEILTSELIAIDDPTLKRSLEQWFETRGPGFLMVSPEDLAESWAEGDFWSARAQMTPREYFECELRPANQREDSVFVTKPAVREQKKGDPPKNQPCPCGSGIKYKRCHGS